MRIDPIIRDVRRSAEQLVKALLNGLTAAENFRGEGKVGQVLTSRGPDRPPTYQDIPTVPGSDPNSPIDADRLLTGTVPSGRLIGAYPSITRTGVLDELRVAGGVFAHRQLIDRDQVIPDGWGCVLVGPIDVQSTVDVGGVMEVLG